MLRSLSWKITSPVAVIAIVCTLLFSLVSPFLIERFVKETAVDNAKELVKTFRGVRNYYSENVIEKIRASGNFHVTAMHKSDKLGIPVAATFLIELVDYELGSDQITTNFTSPYPFRNRLDRKQDPFQQRAWQSLSDKPEDYYVEVEKSEQQTRIRVAQADRLSEQSCVDCHNSHPDSLKRGWRLNDVRGLLEVNTVVDGWLQRGIEISRILTAISLLCFAMIILVNYRAARRVSAPLLVITNSLNQLSQGKNAQLEQIKPAYHEISELNDAFVGFREKEKQRRALQKEVEQLAYYDPLTGLENRTGFQRSLDKLLTTQRAQQRKVTVLIIDVDRFRDINDTLGYQAGDQVLCAIAQKLMQIKPEEGLLARLSEDNFAIAVAADQHNNDEGADDFFANIIQLLSEPMCWQDNQVMLSVNVGTSCSSHEAKDSAEMLIQANIALYAAKEGGRNKAVKHLPALSQAALARVDLVREITEGVENDEFIAFYQPQFCIRTGKIIGAEALMRWRRSDGRLVSPVEFIPSAEQAHLIVPMGASILTKACQACHDWQDEVGLQGVRVAVNVSSVQFIDRDMKALVSDTLLQTGLKPNLLELEITESAMLDDVRRVIDILSALRELGIELALDDFGTGYSSLSYLKRLPIDRLKIDRAFVKDLLKQPEDRAILAMVCQLGKQLSLKVLAEGVEDKEQIQMLADAGCEEAQGFYYAKPMPLDEFIAFSRQYSNDTAK